jgi:hypothetical protein
MILTNARNKEEFEKNIVLEDQEILEMIKNDNIYTDDILATKETENQIINRSFCITGTLSKQRKEFEALIVKYGGHYHSSVSKNTTYLIVGEDIGKEKIKKAAEFDVKVINEKKFLSFIPSDNRDAEKLKAVKQFFIDEIWKKIKSGCEFELNGVRGTCFEANSEDGGIIDMICYSGCLRQSSPSDKIKIVYYSYC